MASDRIVVTASGISNVVSELKAEQSNIKGYISSLDTELGNINKAWQGADATKYTEKMKDDYKVLLTSINESFDSYIEFLSKVYGEYEKLDSEFAGKSIEV